MTKPTLSEIEVKEILTRLPEMAYISEMKYGRNTKSFWVRLPGCRMDKKLQKSFTYSKCGSKENSLLQAKLWRDKQYIKGIKAGLFLEYFYSYPTRNLIRKPKNGRLGIFIYNNIHKVIRNGKLYDIREYAYVASWIEYDHQKNEYTRKSVRKFFSINKYGKEEAKRLAIEARTNIEKYLNSRKHKDLRKKWMDLRNKSILSKLGPMTYIIETISGFRVHIPGKRPKSFHINKHIDGRDEALFWAQDWRDDIIIDSKTKIKD